MSKKTLFVIVGPTAIGKTATAIRVAQELGTEILSCDSRQFYKELNIGVARPTDEELAAVKHHFIANLSIHDSYNVSMYEHDALAMLDDLFATHDTAVAVGGSGLYVDALCQGITEMPDPDPEIRAELKKRLQSEAIVLTDNVEMAECIEDSVIIDRSGDVVCLLFEFIGSIGHSDTYSGLQNH